MKAGRATLRTVLLGTVVTASLLSLASCPNPVADLLNSDGWGFLGTWVSQPGPASGNPGTCYMLTVNADGTFRSQDTGATVVITGTYTVESVSVSGNARTMRINYAYSSGSMHDYVLARVTDGTTYESVWTGLLPYPPSIMITDPNYKKFTLQ